MELRDPIYAPDGRTWYTTLLAEAEKRGKFQEALEAIADDPATPEFLRTLAREALKG